MRSFSLKGLLLRLYMGELLPLMPGDLGEVMLLKEPLCSIGGIFKTFY